MSTAAKTPNYNLSQVAGSDIPDWITDYTSDMSKIDAALKENADDIATVRPDEFSEESTYAAGDYCIKDNVIYKAKTAVEAGAFDISDWTATTIFDELSGLNQKMKWNLLNVYNLTTENTSATIPSTANEILIFAGPPNVGNGNQVYGGKSYIIPSTEHNNCIVKDKELYNASTGSTVEATGLYCYWNNNILSMRIETGTARARVYYR